MFGDQPRFAWIEQAGVEVQVTVATLQVGDIISVHAGEVMPIDGTVVGGAASVDQHMLTGEAQPVEKSAGTPMFAATIVRSGKLNVRVDQTGAATVAAQIGQMLNQTLDYKSTVESRGQQIADRSALPSLVLGALTLPLLGPYQALAVLLAAFGYNMRIVAPISVLNFLRLASAQGILIKDGRGLELLSKVDTVLFDKTGTLTQEEPTVAAIHPCPGWTAEEVLMYAAAAETRQTHPVACAILHAAQAQAVPVLVIDEAAYEIGFGIKVTVSDKTGSDKTGGDKIVRVGSARFMAMENIGVPPDLHAQQAAAQMILGQKATPETLAALRTRLGLDQPAPVRYLAWIGGVLRGDWGESLIMQLPVAEKWRKHAAALATVLPGTEHIVQQVAFYPAGP